MPNSIVRHHRIAIPIRLFRDIIQNVIVSIFRRSEGIPIPVKHGRVGYRGYSVALIIFIRRCLAEMVRHRAHVAHRIIGVLSGECESIVEMVCFPGEPVGFVIIKLCIDTRPYMLLTGFVEVVIVFEDIFMAYRISLLNGAVFAVVLRVERISKMIVSIVDLFFVYESSLDVGVLNVL